MIPLGDLEPRRRAPVATRLLIVVNVAAWLYVLWLLDRPAALRDLYDTWSFDGTELSRAIAAGHATAATFLPLLAHQFLHAGWLHILGNMLYLWIFGPNVEDHLGPLPFVALYLACGAIAAVGQGLLVAGPMVGASGAIAGVLGGYLVLSPRARVRTLVFLGIFITVVTLPALVVIGEWLVIQVLAGLGTMRIASHRATENVAYVAHVVGFASGLVLVALTRARRA